jgi:UDP-hydrolysing UDP-N-acetyl-D-glucosamine 2-epimerase
VGAFILKKRKICIVITTRGNYAKMKSVMLHILQNPNLELQLILAGGILLPKFGDMASYIENEGFKIDQRIYFLIEGENLVTMTKSAGVAISEFSTAFENLKPDVVIVIADRFESLSVSMTAAYLNIPVAHVEGGEVSGSIDESIRHAITKLSHLHFPATEDAALRIEKMGERKGTIFTVGNTSFDVIDRIKNNQIDILIELEKEKGVGPVIDLFEPYILILQHPVTTEYNENFHNIGETIKAVDALKIPTIWIWPNMDAGSDGISSGIRKFREEKQPNYIHFFKSLPIEYFAPLLYNSACVVGNSSSGIREASFLGIPSVNIGTRQTGRARCSNVVDVGYQADEIMDAILKQKSRGRINPDFYYGDGNAGEKVVDVLENFEFILQKKITY